MNATDIRLFAADGTYTLDPEHWDPDGVTGADKVADRLVSSLLTPQGSVPGRPTDGSPFLNLVAGFNTDFDIHASFLTALPAAVATVQASELSTEDNSEKYGAARLDLIDIVEDRAIIYLSVTAKDGSRPSGPVSFDLMT